MKGDSPIRVLLVDDQRIIVESVREMLQSESDVAFHFCLEASRALAEAIEVAPTVILQDLVMPGGNGLDLVRQYRANEQTMHVPMVILSVKEDPEVKAEAFRLGVNDYLVKLPSAVELIARIRYHSGAYLSAAESRLAYEALRESREQLRQRNDEIRRQRDVLAGQARELAEKNVQLGRLRDKERLYALSLERELEIGREIQESFLPDELPRLSGWEIAARFTPARQVAGHFYDAFPLPSGDRIGLVIADVCGKGVGAALYMALFRSLLRASAGEESTARRPDTAATLTRAVGMTNDYIAETHGRATMFATLFFGILDPSAGSLSYINGGHEAPILLAPSGLKERLGPTGPAVGLFPEKEFGVKEAHLSPGDTLFAFTDGVTETQDSSGAFYTEERLLSLVEEPALSAAALLDRVETSVAGFIGGAERSDDLALLAVRRASDTDVNP